MLLVLFKLSHNVPQVGGGCLHKNRKKKFEFLTHALETAGAFKKNVMKFYPILFSTLMVPPINQGNKTQTRRVVKPQPKNQDYTPKSFADHFGKHFWEFRKSPTEVEIKIWECPYGQVGDVLWVRENYYAYGIWLKNGKTKTGKQKWKFVRDIAYTSVAYLDNPPKDVLSNTERETHGWFKRSSLFMPKEACRFFLKITDIRVERLQDISEQDAIAEGVEPIGFDQKSQRVTRYRGYPIDLGYFYNARQSFATLWHSINGEDSWNSNPWVWVISFERIERPIDF